MYALLQHWWSQTPTSDTSMCCETATSALAASRAASPVTTEQHLQYAFLLTYRINTALYAASEASYWTQRVNQVYVFIGSKSDLHNLPGNKHFMSTVFFFFHPFWYCSFIICSKGSTLGDQIWKSVSKKLPELNRLSDEITIISKTHFCPAVRSYVARNPVIMFETHKGCSFVCFSALVLCFIAWLNQWFTKSFHNSLPLRWRNCFPPCVSTVK